MKIITPKNVLFLLILILIVVNIWFIINHISQPKPQTSIKSNIGQENFLKNYINFNDTTFRNEKDLYLHYGSNNKKYDLNLDKVLHHKNSSFSQIFCDYFFDEKARIFVDSQKRLCGPNNFDINSRCCKIENTTAQEPISCEIYNPMCCSYRYLCISNCMNIIWNTALNDTIIFNDCVNLCNPTLLTKTYLEHYCFITEENVKNLAISMVFSN